MIDEMLNNYKKNVATIEMLKIKINQWQYILTKDTQEIDMIYSKPKTENLGVQTSHNSNPIESMLIRVENQKEKINAWISCATEKIMKLEQKNKFIDILIGSLDEETSFIIKQKHFEKKKWNIITQQFNSKYRSEYNEYITTSGVRKKYEMAKKELLELLGEINENN